VARGPPGRPHPMRGPARSGAWPGS
jgi:hypothetical protein